MSNVAIVSAPIAPVHPLGQGKAVRGGHVVAWRAQLKTPFAGSDTLSMSSSANPWRPNTPGGRFFESVLMAQPKTVAAALELGSKAGFKASDVQGHLAWLFTWAGRGLLVNGQPYAPISSVQAPSAPVVAKAPAKAAPKAAPKSAAKALLDKAIGK
jgi:hypothetical protein